MIKTLAFDRRKKYIDIMDKKLRNGKGNIFARKIEPADKDDYKKLYLERASYKDINYGHMFETEWQKIQTGDYLVWAIIEEERGAICGYWALEDVKQKSPHVAVDIKDAYQGNGYGTSATELLMDHIKDAYSFDYIQWDVNEDNIPSRKLAEKVGGIISTDLDLIPKEIIDQLCEKGILKYSSYEEYKEEAYQKSNADNNGMISYKIQLK